MIRLPRNVWVFLGYFGLSLVFYHSLLSNHVAPVAYDQRSGGYALRDFVMEGWKQGEMRWWNSTAEGGFPTVSGLTFEYFYPDHLLWFIMDIDQAFKWSFVLHTALASFVLFWVLSALGVSFPLALAGGAVLGFGYIPPQVYSGHLAKGIVLTWFPLIVWLAVEGVRRGSWWIHALWGGILGVLIGIQQLQMVYYAYLAVGLAVVLALGLFGPRSPKFWLDRLVRAAGAGLLSLGIGAAQWYPAFFYIRHFTLRRAMGIEKAMSWSMDVQDVLSLWFPLFSGISLPREHYWGSNPFRHDVVYLGVMGLSGTIAFLWFVRKATFRQSVTGKWSLLTALVGLFFLLISMAGRTPLFYLLYHTLPMFSRFRAHALALGFAQVMFIITAVLALSKLTEEQYLRVWRGWRWVGGSLIVLALVGGAMPQVLYGPLKSLFVLTPEKARALQAHLPHLALGLGWVGLATLLIPRILSSGGWILPLAVVLELFVMTRPFLKPALPLKEELRRSGILEVRRALPAGDPDPVRILPLFFRTEDFNWMYAGLQTAGGGFPFASGRYLQLVGAEGFVLSPASFVHLYQNPFLLSLMDVDHVLMPVLPDTATLRRQYGTHPAYPMLLALKFFQERLVQERMVPLQGQRFGLYAPPDSAKRVRFYAHAVPLPGADTQAVVALMARGRAVLDTLFLSDSAVRQPPVSPAESPHRLILKSYAPGKIQVEVESGGGWVFLAEAYTDQWEAQVDQDPPQPVLRAMHAFMAVPVPPGRHQVTFRYHPRREKTGLVVSLLSLVLMFGPVGMVLRRAPKEA